MSDERLAVLYCPYCGEEDLRPAEAYLETSPAAWACHSCRRAFTVRLLGPLDGSAGHPSVRSSVSSPSARTEQEAAL